MKKELTTLRSKKIGVLIKQMREIHDQTVESCAGWLGIQPSDFESIENGEAGASLPQIESLSYYLDFPFDLVNFTSQTDTAGKNLTQQVNINLLELRNKMIATVLKQKREENGLSLEEISGTTEIPLLTLLDFETGEAPIPLPDLQSLQEVLGLSMEQFYAQNSPLKHDQPQTGTSVGSLPANFPPELVEFISKPANLPYLDLAMRISRMDSSKIRAIASSLLEITY
jgi:transcriptional regulator with XRE-family HTH domain